MSTKKPLDATVMKESWTQGIIETFVALLDITLETPTLVSKWFSPTNSLQTTNKIKKCIKKKHKKNYKHNKTNHLPLTWPTLLFS